MDDNEAKQRAVRDAKELLAKTSEPKDKLSIYAGLAAVQASLKDEDGLSATLQQAFVIADDLVRKSIDKDPAAGSWMRPGVDTAASMVRNLAKKQSSLVTNRIDDVRQAPLRVLLLIAAVESLDPEAKTERGPMIQFRFTT
jgi:hypothetical protein